MTGKNNAYFIYRVFFLFGDDATIFSTHNFDNTFLSINIKKCDNLFPCDLSVC